MSPRDADVPKPHLTSELIAYIEARDDRTPLPRPEVVAEWSRHLGRETVEIELGRWYLSFAPSIRRLGAIPEDDPSFTKVRTDALEKMEWALRNTMSVLLPTQSPRSVRRRWPL